MDLTLVANALQLVIYVSIPLLASVMAGAVVAGVLRVVTQIDDQVIGFAGRFVGVVLFFSLAFTQYANEVLAYTQRIWGGADFYQ